MEKINQNELNQSPTNDPQSFQSIQKELTKKVIKAKKVYSTPSPMTISMNNILLSQLDNYCSLTGFKKSEVISQALNEFLKSKKI